MSMLIVSMGMNDGEKTRTGIPNTEETMLTARSTLRSHSGRCAGGRGKRGSIRKRLGELVARTRVHWILFLGG